MPHDIVGGHVGHNHAADHLHSHMPEADLAAELQVLTAQFIDGFRAARDKAAYLAIAGVPLEIAGDGGPALKLVDVQLTTEWQVGTAAPSFGSRELSYLPYPGEMISERTNMGFVYVSLDEKRVVDLRELLRPRLATGHGHGPQPGPGQGQGHGHGHGHGHGTGNAHDPAHRHGLWGGQSEGHGHSEGSAGPHPPAHRHGQAGGQAEGHRHGQGGSHSHSHGHSHGQGDGHDRSPARGWHRGGAEASRTDPPGQTHGHRHD